MQLIFYMLAAILIGAFVSAQPAWNAILARSVGSLVGAAVINTSIAFLLCLIFLPLAGGARFTHATMTSVPWWVYLGGVAGALFVAAGVVVAPVTGALIFFVCIVAGQLTGSVIADHFGAFGLEVRPISAPRLLGISLVVIGAILVGKG